jgi:hypothetical protein
MNFRERLFGQKDILSIGFANLFGSGITAIFWFYIASLLGPAEYGQIHYFLAIAGMAQLVSLFATPNAITVYVAKNNEFAHILQDQVKMLCRTKKLLLYHFQINLQILLTKYPFVQIAFP